MSISSKTKKTIATSGSSPQAELERMPQLLLALFILGIAVVFSFKGGTDILPNHPLVATALLKSFILVALINVYNRFMAFVRG